MNTSTVENYLKAILSLQESEDKPVPMGQIAECLQVTPGTVTMMMKHLADRNMVHYKSRQGVTLTKNGSKEAHLIIRKHRLIELFLVEIMGFDWADVHREAEAMEHTASDLLIDRMDEMLGNPTQDPHGSPIPAKSGKLPTLECYPLSECQPDNYRLIRVREESDGFLSWMKEQGLIPGAKFKLEVIDTHAETLQLKLAKTKSQITVGFNAASKLLVSS